MLALSHLKHKKTRDSYSLTEHMLNLFKTNEESDVNITIFDSKTNDEICSYKLHKLVLKRCTYFNNMFSHNWKEGCTPVHGSVKLYYHQIGWIEKPELDVFFESFYIDDFDDINDKLIPMCLPIHCLAKEIGFESLVNYLEEAMIRNINNETIVYIFGYLRSYCCNYDIESNGIMKCCMQWIKAWLCKLELYNMVRIMSIEMIRYLIQSPDIVDAFNGKTTLLTQFIYANPSYRVRVKDLVIPQSTKNAYPFHKSYFYFRNDYTIKNEVISSTQMDSFNLSGCNWKISMMYNTETHKPWLSISCTYVNTCTLKKFDTEIVVYCISNKNTRKTTHRAEITANYDRINIPDAITEDEMENQFTILRDVNNPYGEITTGEHDTRSNTTKCELKVLAFVVNVCIND